MKMKKLSLFLAVAFAVLTFTAGAGFAADTLAEIQKRGTLRVGMEPGYMPFELTNKKGEIWSLFLLPGMALYPPC